MLPFYMKAYSFLAAQEAFIFITDREIIFRFLNMHKGLHFDLKVASCYFTYTGFSFL